MGMERIEKACSEMMTLLSGDSIEELVRIIQDSGYSVPERRELEPLRALPSTKASILSILRSFNDRCDMKAVAMGLVLMSRKDAQIPYEVCWTSPQTGSGIRLTLPVMKNLINSAEADITVIGYDVSKELPDILGPLTRKSELGVMITVLFDKLEEKVEFLKWARQLRNKKLYSRPYDPSNPYSSLHAKCLIVDRKVVMLGSPNLTYHGLFKNIEMSIVIREPGAVAEFVRMTDQLKSALEPVH